MELEAFLSDWLRNPGGAERSNAQSFLIGLCSVLGLEPPRPASAASGDNDYVFERSVRGGDVGHGGRIDLYKRDAFILEAKQSLKAEAAEAALRSAGMAPQYALGRSAQADGRFISRSWDKLMRSALEQARRYVLDLPPDHAAPPFLIACDVGRAFEIYADFSGTGRTYTYFPDRRTYRVLLEDLRDPIIRTRLKAIWCDPQSLDPARRKQRATREIARQLAAVSLELEGQGNAPEEVALFLMRCIFTMFACSVSLLPESGFIRLLEECRSHPSSFQPLLKDLWLKMNDPLREARYFHLFGDYAPYFGGKLFNNSRTYVLTPQAMSALQAAAECSWADVEPSIFGALLENALGRHERRELGAHYTPRAFVERLVQATIMTDLREDWRLALVKIEDARHIGDAGRAQRLAQSFHAQLRRTRVLDPACGTGNFLYVALEAMKGLEAEVLETLVQLGASESIGLDEVDPRQFLGLEINPRAVAIAELVLWIGYLQLHYRSHSGHPAEPILRAFGTIEHRSAVLTWDGYRAPSMVKGDKLDLHVGPDPRRPEWPEAEFIVGNPPFTGGKDLRARLGEETAEAIWEAHPQMNRSADLVMYWWDHAADLLSQEGSPLRCFGFVTTNSITQTFQRQTLERHLTGPRPLHLTYAIPDHPWTHATPAAAAVRVAMTVAQAGPGPGVRLSVVHEEAQDGCDPRLVFEERRGRINSDLSVGVDLTQVQPLLANRGLCSPGVKLHGAGFIVSLEQAQALGLGRRPGLEDYVRPYRNGRDIVQTIRDAWVIDLYPLDAAAVRTRFPEVYQHLLATVKPHRDRNRIAFRREHWWWFGATHEMYRSFTSALDRFIATPETAKHRIFVFRPSGVRADNMLVSVGLSEAYHLGVLSSRAHLVWSRATGAMLEDRPRYTKSACFDPFPFPDPPPALRAAIGETAEELEATRRQVQSEHPELSLTTLYNAIIDLRSGLSVTPDLMQQGRLTILKELHASLDRLVPQSYGWSPGLCEAKLLERLAELNAIRAREEQAGRTRWLRPTYQAPRFSGAHSTGALDIGPAGPTAARIEALPTLPAERGERHVAVLQMLEATGLATSAADLALRFKGSRQTVEQKVADALLILVSYGRISVLPDGRCLAKRSA